MSLSSLEKTEWGFLVRLAGTRRRSDRRQTSNPGAQVPYPRPCLFATEPAPSELAGGDLGMKRGQIFKHRPRNQKDTSVCDACLIPLILRKRISGRTILPPEMMEGA